MNIGVIGTGNIGEVIIRKLRDVGYPVKMAHARGPESLKDLAAQTGAILGRLNWRPSFDRILDLVAHHRCLCG